ncbi:MAG: hypothetical protein KAI17_18845, partial [Thiotrichaceae bacterium]|nr:hypothetical protein [Thiotrichaceae bacterium]
MKTLLSLFIITILMVYSGESHAQLETTERTHFIVLIRDTGLMTQKFFPQKMIIPTLPKLLYQGVNTPIYQPKRDHLSVVFVGIHRDQNTSICKEEAALSALPQHLFQWQMVEQGQNQNTFTQSLRQWLNQECRGEGRVSSTVLAQTMILPYVHQKMADTGYGTLRFSRTILVMLDNEAYYGDTFPSTELSELERQEKVRDIEQAASFVNAVSSAFHIITPRDWIFTVNPYKHNKLEQGNTLLDGTNTLRYRLVEVQPLDTNVDNYIDYTKKVKLERVAISNEKMQLVQQEGKKIGLRLLHSDRLRPEQIELKFWDQTHGSWKIGQHHLPSTSVINIKDCIDSNKCELLEDAMIYVPLMGAEELYLMSDDPALTAGQIRFKVRFRYNAVYDHHYIDTNWKTIDIKPVKPFIIPNSPFLGWLFPKIILDNKTLTNKYSFAQDAQNGLTHKIAYARIVATRKMLQMVCLAFLVSSLVIILFILLYKYLHKKAYHRLFNPLLDWNLAKKIDIDFNQSPGARVLVGTLNFKNEGHVPWFGRLHGNRDYPDYIIDIHLDYNNKKLIEHGFSLANNMGEPFGFREVGEGSLLKRKIPYRVNHETPIYVFLATDVINDFKAH